MKQVIKNYTFNAGARTITLSDFSGGQPVLLERIALITDTTTNKILYNFADSTVATATVSGNNVITLSALQGGEANGDKLRIDYEDVSGDPTYDTPVLASGAASSAKQDIGNTSLASIDSKIPSSPAQEHTTAGSPSSARLTDGTSFYKATTPSDTQPVSAASLPLPSGAATGAKQDTGNTSLANIDTSTATVAGAVSGSVVQSNLKQVNGVTTQTGTGAAGTGTQRVAVASDSSINAVQSGTWNVTNVSGTVSDVRQTTASNLNAQVVGNAASGAADSGNPVKVGGKYNLAAPTLTDGQRGDLQLDASGNLKVAGTISTSGTVTANQGTANATPWNENIAQVGGTAIDTNSGSKSGGTVRMVLATDQPQLTNALKVDGSGVTQPVSAASLPLPTGASTGAKQDTGNTSLASIDSKITTVNTGAVVVSSSALPTGAATSAKQDTGNTSLGNIDTTTAALSKAEDAAHVSGDKGIMPLAVRNDTRGSLSDTDGDYTPLQLNSSGDLRVDGSAVTQPVSGSVSVTGVATSAKQSDGSQKTQVVDGSGNVIGSTSNALDINIKSGNITGFATSANQTSGNTSLASIDTKVPSNLTVTSTRLLVDGSGVTQPVNGTVTANAGTNLNTSALALETGGNLATVASAVHAEDAASADGDKGVTLLATRKATPVNTSSTDGDYETLQVNAGRLWVDASGKTLTVDGTGGTFPVTGTVTANAGSGTFNIQSNASVNAAQVAGTTTSVNNGTVDNGTQRVTLASDSTGQVKLATGANTIGSLTANQSVNLSQVAGGTAINSGVTGAIAAGGDTASGATDAGNPLKIGGVGRTTNPTAVTDGQRANALFDKLGKQVVVGSIRDLKGVQQTTITASTSETTIVTAAASTFLDLYGLILTNTSASATKVTIKDSTSGTTRAVIEVPATDTRGFMLPESGGIPQATVNNNWTATCGTSVSSLEVTALYVKNT